VRDFTELAFFVFFFFTSFSFFSFASASSPALALTTAAFDFATGVRSL
jgi:hypothetical protein